MCLRGYGFPLAVTVLVSKPIDRCSSHLEKYLYLYLLIEHIKVGTKLQKAGHVRSDQTSFILRVGKFEQDIEQCPARFGVYAIQLHRLPRVHAVSLDVWKQESFHHIASK